MWVVIGIIAIAMAMAVIEIPNLAREARKRDAACYIVLFIVGAGGLIAYSMDVKLPVTLGWMGVLYSPIGRWMGELLK
ncbi:hypothetical protein RB620_24395 [Paenibacillus sp. LHD-117]|uniref:hypothetical protein n=1 Tax=Paenibacillus sp. LHD-117 TaxID=3071412 RepID=UPI0027E0C355|nr:hypothetical protein [Paenibacillus sp. LHD-117]MDQ6422576.1 hypothetical protein [Paenibacillus sp. LHD-117]